MKKVFTFIKEVLDRCIGLAVIYAVSVLWIVPVGGFEPAAWGLAIMLWTGFMIVSCVVEAILKLKEVLNEHHCAIMLKRR